MSTTREEMRHTTQTLDVQRLREDFPILHQEVHGRKLVYLDNAATSQKPRQVIDAISHYYEKDNSNVHRGVHYLSQRATVAYEGARTTVRNWINAAADKEIIFTRGTTEAINLVAATWGEKSIQAGDEIVISRMEHHSNIVPWQILCERKGAVLIIAPINDAGELIVEELEKLLTPKTKLLALPHVSNSLGTINPVRELIAMAHERGITVLLDGAQALPHMKVDVRDLDVDFYTFSGHKVFAPTGVGGLYGKEELLKSMPPYQGGGDMIRSVTFEKTTYNDLPYKFEAGTPNIAGGIGLGAALDYIKNIGIENIEAWEKELLEYATGKLQEIDGVRILGTAREKAGVLSFIIEGVHPHDVGTILDQEGIAVRTGHHCTQPLWEWYGVPATSRASLAFYNTKEEIDVLAQGILRVKEIFG